MENMITTNTLIIYDNFLIGGIQRLILDQCYEISRLKNKCELVILSSRPSADIPTFEKREQNLINQYGVKITYMPGSRFKQLTQIYLLIKRNSYNYVFAHSLRGGILVWFSRFILRKNLYISTIFHQLPSLSAPKQRRRRYLYSRFTDNLLIFSESARKDWNYYLERSNVTQLISGSKQIKTCRNGVFLPRVSLVGGNLLQSPGFSGRLVFIGRLKAWKGLDTFLEVTKREELKSFQILIVTPSDPIDFINKLDLNFQKRITCVVGKSVSEVVFKPDDIHLYPANYGPESLFTEGVSINVLEMACLGIPSLITNGGSETWPELVRLGLVIEVDWSNLDSVVDVIKSGIKLPKNSEIGLARQLIDIKNNIFQITNSK
jgi:glycosyltransferase involved in cell wall biosynthesis